MRTSLAASSGCRAAPPQTTIRYQIRATCSAGGTTSSIQLFEFTPSQISGLKHGLQVTVDGKTSPRSSALIPSVPTDITSSKAALVATSPRSGRSSTTPTQSRSIASAISSKRRRARLTSPGRSRLKLLEVRRLTPRFPERLADPPRRPPQVDARERHRRPLRLRLRRRERSSNHPHTRVEVAEDK